MVLADRVTALSADALYVYVRLCAFMGGRADSIRELLRAMEMSRPTLRPVIRELVEKKFVMARYGSMGRIQLFVCDEVQPE